MGFKIKLSKTKKKTNPIVLQGNANIVRQIICLLNFKARNFKLEI